MKENILWPILQQARTYATIDTAQYGKNFDVDKFEHKFAELIVKECADAAGEWYMNHNDIHWDPATHILQRFGVEE